MSDQVHPAATVILWRHGPVGPEVLMGQRGKAAVFMPSKFVFPGGRVDPVDHHSGPADGWLGEGCITRLAKAPCPAHALAAAARRELAEETGLTLTKGQKAPLLLVFRAITPRGSARRFDAYFFLAPAEAAEGDQTEFSGASTELTALHWTPVQQARALDLPFITEVVLSEVAAHLEHPATETLPHGVPFFDNLGPVPTFRRMD